MTKLVTVAAAAALCVASGSALAIDDDKDILCATTQVQDCPEVGDCKQVRAEDVDAPTFMRINLKKKEIGIGTRSVKIERTEEVENRVIFQGAEDGREDRPDGVGWTMSIDKESGRFSIAAVGSQEVVILFGACTEI
jgi:hypothetical protein